MKSPVKRDFSGIYLIAFSESAISEIQKLWGSSFFSKRSKCELDFKHAANNWEKVFYFWDNCIWIGIVKFSLLRTGYLSLAANVLTSSPRFYMLIRETFSNSISLPLTNEHDRGTVIWVGESQFYWHAEPWDYLLTHCLRMTTILFLIQTIERYQFRCNYLKNEKVFLNFFLLF